MSREKLENIFILLLEHHGPQGWWPLVDDHGNSVYHNPQEVIRNRAFEVIAGAILTQNTQWHPNVERAIFNLAKPMNGNLTAEGLLDIPQDEIASLVRSSGYYNQKAETLRNIASFILEKDILAGKNELYSLRKQLLNLKRIGTETADSILLYALGLPVFVVDLYTVRIFNRLGITKTTQKDTLRQEIMSSLPLDSEVYMEFHALLVEHGKGTCKKREQKCKICPLGKLCPRKQYH